LTQSDLLVQHELKLGKTGKRLIVNATILNLFDQRTVLNYNSSIRRAGTTPVVDEAAFYAGRVNVQSLVDAAANGGGMSVDPRFMMPSSWQDPRLVRFGVKFTF